MGGRGHDRTNNGGYCSFYQGDSYNSYTTPGRGFPMSAPTTPNYGCYTGNRSPSGHFGRGYGSSSGHSCSGCGSFYGRGTTYLQPGRAPLIRTHYTDHYMADGAHHHDPTLAYSHEHYHVDDHKHHHAPPQDQYFYGAPSHHDYAPGNQETYHVDADIHEPPTTHEEDVHWLDEFGF